MAGASAYPRFIEFAALREIADEVGAYLMVDIAHIAGLIAAKVHPSPVPLCEVVTGTTHKTLRGPRGGLILCKQEFAKAVDRAVFPGLQGGPLMHIVAAKAVSLREAMAPDFTRYGQQIVENAKAYKAKARIIGVLVQKMAPPGEEVILGVNRYPVFGPLIMFGLGGIYVELFKDVVFRFAPIGRNNARRMVRDIKAYPKLDGFRGTKKSDVECIQKLLVSLSDMVVDHPEIKELDINPLRVHPVGEGATVADVRIFLEEVDEQT